MKRKLAIFSFFVVSFASLAYQIAWLRLLIKIFGSSVYAVSTILTSFMAGLAIGSYFIGRYISLLIILILEAVPTTLIGGVYPVANKILVRQRVGSDIGLIYSLNNLAAAFGSIISGFLLITYYGVANTIIITSALVFASGTLVLLTEEGEK